MIDVKVVQSKNAPSPIEVTVVGIAIDVSAVQSLNASVGILVNCGVSTGTTALASTEIRLLVVMVWSEAALFNEETLSSLVPSSINLVIGMLTDVGVLLSLITTTTRRSVIVTSPLLLSTSIVCGAVAKDCTFGVLLTPSRRGPSTPCTHGSSGVCHRSDQ